MFGDDDGELRVRFGERDRSAAGRRRPDDRDALAGQEAVERVGEGADAVQFDPAERLGEHVEHGG